MRKITYIICLTFILSGCGFATATGPQFIKPEAVSDDYALLYFYRGDFGNNQSAYTPSIYINNVKAIELKRSAYSVLKLNQGKYTILFKHIAIAGYPDLNMEIDIKNGERRYIEVYDPVSVSGGGGLTLTYTSNLTEISEEVALEALKDKKLNPSIAFNK